MNEKELTYLRHCMDFVTESNKIEGIYGCSNAQVSEFMRFMALPKVSITELKKFVKVYQPDAQLRNKVGLNVRVGNYYPPLGGPHIRVGLEALLEEANNTASPREAAFKIHLEYETLHPFTDGNGRSGRMLWAWMYRDLSLGFLHRFYYQSLEYSRHV